jgi:hypothetical protein
MFVIRMKSERPLYRNNWVVQCDSEERVEAKMSGHFEMLRGSDAREEQSSKAELIS